MRTALVLLLLLTGCGTVPKAFSLTAEPSKYVAEMFWCPVDPGAWAADATDPVIAANVRNRFDALQACRARLNTLCLLLDANGQIAPKGSCLKGPTSPSVRP
jgi:hypothetical protein